MYVPLPVSVRNLQTSREMPAINELPNCETQEHVREIRNRDFGKMKKRSRTRQVTVDALVSTFRNKNTTRRVGESCFGKRPVTWKEEGKSTGGIKS